MGKPGDWIAGFAVRFLETPMATWGEFRGALRRGHLALLALAVAMAGLVGVAGQGLAVQTDDNLARVRVVHGMAGGGPLDVYIDGSLALIGLVFPETSGEFLLEGGEHQFAAVPTGSSLDDAIVAGTIALGAGAQTYLTIVGTPDSASLGLFQVDSGLLEAGRARFRVINGIPDGGEIVPAFSGGEAISTPLGFGDATEYAAIDAGTYDLDLLDAVSGVPLLSLPQTPFAEGTVTDVILVGQVADGTLQGLIETTATAAAPVAQAAGQSAHIMAGSCDESGTLVADLGLVRVGQGEAVGTPDVLIVANGFGVAAVPFATLIGAPHAITVTAGGGAADDVVVCGDIGGQLTENGALIISLRSPDTLAANGIAVIAPGLEDPNATGVSIFLAAEGPVGQDPATPVAVSR
jgi:hypothetical protein